MRLAGRPGYPFEIKNDLYAEPQAQVIYSSIDLDDSNDLAANVRFEDMDSLIGRLGVRIAKDREVEGSDNTVRRTNAWIRPSVWHEFKGATEDRIFLAEGFRAIRSGHRRYLGQSKRWFRLPSQCPQDVHGIDRVSTSVRRQQSRLRWDARR
ncbi:MULTISPECIES: autotransporter domain-containing protein [unclassified Pseudomonas]|uniref:autotransporter domain-containing protein n=1 Tax=unclassified Pseudomonas TaxID=196821 RepID=UPI002114C740|nr:MULTISPECIES: autotransporter outer membrane beta-barrel domain-containing protein [unclassified Pseudomonas]